VIFNENHVKLRDEYKQKINPQTVPLNYKSEPAKENDVDFSYIGRAKEVKIFITRKKVIGGKITLGYTFRSNYYAISIGQ
jgi:hypothetical protein